MEGIRLKTTVYDTVSTRVTNHPGIVFVPNESIERQVSAQRSMHTDCKHHASTMNLGHQQLTSNKWCAILSNIINCGEELHHTVERPFSCCPSGCTYHKILETCDSFKVLENYQLYYFHSFSPRDRLVSALTSDQSRVLKSEHTHFILIVTT